MVCSQSTSILRLRLSSRYALLSRSKQRLLSRRPRSSRSHHDTRRDGHWPNACRSLEESPRQSTRRNRPRHIVPPPHIVNNRIDGVVNERNNTRAVTHKASPTRNLVKHSVQPQPKRGVVHTKRPAQPFPCAQQSSNGQTRKVRRTGPVAQIVAPSTRRESSTSSLELVGLIVDNVEVLYVFFAQAGQGVETGGIELGVGEEGRGSGCVGGVV